MNERDRTGGYILVAAMAAVMWLVEVYDAAGGDPDSAGIRPRDPDGLVGVAVSPFLHGSWGHLIGNTIPFLILGFGIAIGGLARVAAVTGIVAAVGGLGTWLTAPSNTLVIGASGVIFGYATYLIARGVYTRRARPGTWRTRRSVRSRAWPPIAIAIPSTRNGIVLPIRWAQLPCRNGDATTPTRPSASRGRMPSESGLPPAAS